VAEVEKNFNNVVVIVIVSTRDSRFVDWTNKHTSATTLAGAYSDRPPAACLPDGRQPISNYNASQEHPITDYVGRDRQHRPPLAQHHGGCLELVETERQAQQRKWTRYYPIRPMQTPHGGEGMRALRHIRSPG
jgi:hypothetical protein